MQYTLVRNIFSRSNRFEISDIHQQRMCKVAKESGGLFSSIFSLDGEKMRAPIKIKKHYKGLKINYTFFEGGDPVAVLTRKFKWLRSHFILTFSDGSIFKIESDTWRKNYTFLDGEEVVAKLKRLSLQMQRTYELTCLEMRHHEVLMASVVALDQIFDQDNSG
ncbi:MAG: hypothetical protein AAFO82_08645 [Bacteroidota bacterium]